MKGCQSLIRLRCLIIVFMIWKKIPAMIPIKILKNLPPDLS